jgi:hypothetical protein
MMSKEKLVFDVTDVDTIAASDSVGAFVRSSDGTLIDHTDVGGEKGLDVYVLNANLEVTQGTDPWIVGDGGGSLTVDATDLDIRDLVYTSDSVTSHQGGTWTIDSITNAVTVTATDLDIRDLTQADEVTVFQGTSPWVIGDGGGSITVDAVDLDIRDLTAASDSVAAWLSDGSGNAITSTGGALDINIASSDIEIDVENDMANTAIENAATSVTTTSAALLASQLADRRFLYVQNLGGQQVYVGKSGVTTANGLRMSPGAVLELRLGPALSLHAVANGGTQDVRTMQLS